jgi:signal peptidase II
LKKSIIIVSIVILLDQILKFWIKTNMTLGQEIMVAGNWFILHFTENEGMAFGMEFGGEYGKLALSIFRIIAVILLGYYIYHLTRKKAHSGLIFSFSMILAGALGNIIDSAFYGLIFNASSYHTVATLFPPEGGYASFLHGKVVDMLYFPVLKGMMPDWVPIWGGKYFIFFRPVFNLADSAITIGVLYMIIFQRQFFKNPAESPKSAVSGQQSGQERGDEEEGSRDQAIEN